MKLIIPQIGLVAALIVSQQMLAFGQASADPTPEPETGSVTPAPSVSKKPRSSRASRKTPGAVPVMATTSRLGNDQNAIPPLVVRFSKDDASSTGALEDDLAIMNRVLDRALEHTFGEDPPDYKMGIPMTLSAGGRSVRAMYIEGFGALFMAKVNFPVMPPPSAEEKKSERVSDSDWEKAKNEIYSQNEDRWIAAALPVSGPEYDGTKVETLKKEVLESLKNASKLRGLNPSEFVTVTIFGAPSVARDLSMMEGADAKAAVLGDLPVAGRSLRSESNATPQRKHSQNSPSDEEPTAAPQFRRASADLGTHPGGSSQGTVMTIRVKKSDVDGFNDGTIGFDDFQKSAKVSVYPGYGYGITSLNSWIQKGRGQRR
jgi:hypothetical protein